MLLDIAKINHRRYFDEIWTSKNKLTKPVFSPTTPYNNKHKEARKNKHLISFFIDDYSERITKMLYNKKYYWMPRKLDLNQNRFTFGASLEAELLQCSEKTVLILESEHINSELDYLSKYYPTKPFLKVKMNYYIL